jgi:anti-anti-sigma regulatory factor
METARSSFASTRTVRSIFAMHGDVDGLALPAFRLRLQHFGATTAGDIVIDCFDLDSIDVDGADTLLAFHHEMLGFGRRVSIRRVPPRCRATFETTKLSTLSCEPHLPGRRR